jgi:hypothetical protein
MIVLAIAHEILFASSLISVGAQAIENGLAAGLLRGP